jgi:hypothetical protein
VGHGLDNTVGRSGRFRFLEWICGTERGFRVILMLVMTLFEGYRCPTAIQYLFFVAYQLAILKSTLTAYQRETEVDLDVLLFDIVAQRIAYQDVMSSIKFGDHGNQVIPGNGPKLSSVKVQGKGHRSY